MGRGGSKCQERWKVKIRSGRTCFIHLVQWHDEQGTLFLLLQTSIIQVLIDFKCQIQKMILLSRTNTTQRSNRCAIEIQMLKHSWMKKRDTVSDPSSTRFNSPQFMELPQRRISGSRCYCYSKHLVQANSYFSRKSWVVTFGDRFPVW